MKKITSYLLLFIYVNGLLFQVSPIINDILAHTFWRMNHLATVHCVNGKYHVAKTNGMSVSEDVYFTYDNMLCIDDPYDYERVSCVIYVCIDMMMIGGGLTGQGQVSYILFINSSSSSHSVHICC